MVEVVEQIAEIEHAELRQHGRPDRRAGDHHVDRADLHLLDDIAFLAELVVREIVDPNLVADARLQVRGEVLIPHASTEQRAAVDALVATSSDLLQRVGTQFTDKVGAETDRLGAIAAQVTGSAVEVASLGDALGAAVQSFGESNDKLVAHLQRIEAALDKSLVRSDEQLAYYVAQAREVIDLSMMSQKQIIEELQRAAGKRASAGAEAA